MDDHVSRTPLAGLICASLLAASCERSARAPVSQPGAQAGAQLESQNPREVRTALAVLERWERSVAATGELAAYESVVIATKVPGRLRELFVDRGSRVKQGERIGEIESRDYELRVSQSEAALAAARALLGLSAQPSAEPFALEETAVFRRAVAELEETRLRRDRAVALAREGVDSQAQLDTVEAELRAAESRLQEASELVESRRATLAQRAAELEIARAQLAETKLDAPFDGVVVERRAARGAYLATGDALAELVRVDPLRLALVVPEREASALRVGQTVRVELEGVAGELEGVLARLSPTLGANNRTLTVEAELANPDAALRPGAFARARIVIEPDAQALSVPEEALVEFAGIDKVYVVGDDDGAAAEGSVPPQRSVAIEKRVTVGRRARGRAEILSGLEAGALVVLDPGNLQSGDPVRPVP